MKEWTIPQQTIDAVDALTNLSNINDDLSNYVTAIMQLSIGCGSGDGQLGIRQNEIHALFIHVENSTQRITTELDRMTQFIRQTTSH